MSDENLVGGKVNVDKYMALLQSESDLKEKLQQLFLKMKKTEGEDKAEIARLQALLEEQKVDGADKSDSLKLSAELNSLKMELATADSKLKNCRIACDNLVQQNAAATDKNTEKDDLTLISGVGPKLQEKLHKEGITRFEQIAVWKAADIEEFDEKLSFKGRITRDEWIKQAKVLMKK